MDSWNYEQNLDEIDYLPQQNSFCDIFQYEGELGPRIKEGVLDGENLDEYLAEAPDIVHGRNLVGGLRLIYSYIDDNTDCSDSTVFWSQSDFVKIIETFRLPKRCTQMIRRCHCLLAQCPPDAPDNGVSFIFSTMFHHTPFWCFAASWDPETGITNAFLHCTSTPGHRSLRTFKRMLSKMAPWAMHPILLPILIMDMETDFTLLDDEQYTSEISQLEKETRQNPDPSGSVDPLDLDLPSIIQRLNGCSIFLSLIERESETVLLQLAKARAMVLDLQVWYQNIDGLTSMLVTHVDFLIDSRKSLFLRLQNLQRRTQTQLVFTYNGLAQGDKRLNLEVARDPKAAAVANSRENSTNVKTVAMLIMAFLSGTVVASFFAMLMVNQQVNDEGGIMNRISGFTGYYWN